MIAEIRKCLSRRPFMPFTIHSADGMALPVPTVDHAAVSPTGNRVIVFLDDDTTEFLFPLLITRVSVYESDT
jgi:hypothetical protein